MDALRHDRHARSINDARKEPTMTAALDLVRRYLATWNEDDSHARRAAIDDVWAEDGSYVDPLASVAGREEISALIGTLREQMPGHDFRLLDGVDAHHNVARFSWELVPAGGGEAIAEGFDVAVMDTDGRIEHVLGFLDKAPAV
jgi:hypothetical protein